MSMQVLTVIQIIEIFCAYSIMTLILPALLLYRKIKNKSLIVRFMIYLTVGNFFIISLVLFLQLLHISNKFTLTIFTIFAFFAMFVLFYRINPGQKLDEFVENVRKLAEGQYGLRLFLKRIQKQVWGIMKKFFAVAWRRFWNNKLDCVLTLASIAAVMVVYGRNALLQYGYCASDIVVHNYWINAMDQGELFVAGVYPFGFHCVIYYLHQVFHIEIFVLLRLFWVVQTLLIHLLLLAFIRMCCKSKYVAYVGLGVYTFVGLFLDNTYSRYISSLPQEFGMVFILPSIAFLFLFFEQKKKELGQHRKRGRQDVLQPCQEEVQEEEERVYLLDEVLAESAAREAAGQTLPKQPLPEDAQPETIITIEENKKDGSLFIKKVALASDGEAKNVSSDESGNVPEAEIEEENDVKLRLRQRIVRALKREFLKESSQYLAMFALDFSMTLTVHFYNTMIAGIFCLGVGFGFFFRLFRRHYFGRVVCAGILALIISVFPMFVAYIFGTPLQGSLKWGMAVMEGTQTDTKTPVVDEEVDLTQLRGFVFITGSTVIREGEIVSENGELKGGEVLSIGDITVDQHKIKGGQMVNDATILIDDEVYYEGIVIAVGKNLKEREVGEPSASADENKDGQKETSQENEKNGKRKTLKKDGEQGNQIEKKEKTESRLGVAWKKIQSKYLRIQEIALNVVETYLLEEDAAWASFIVLFSIVLLFVLAIVYFILRQTDYAARMMSTAVYMVFMTIMFVAPSMGLPELMDDEGRTCIYYAYSMIPVWSFCADGILNILFGWAWKGKILNLVSFLLIPAVAAATLEGGMVKEIEYTDSMQSNGAVTCLTNIIQENEDETWTIVSANDEMRMGEGHGYHYELDQFLRTMEHKGGSSSIRIPTKKVYFFIEKIPIDYAAEYGNLGQRVSAIGASNPLPRNNGLEMYMGENRWIEMSRMYYWARRFAWLYPNEISIYYESDDFICYCVEQNGYSYYNFSIDYNYNMQSYVESTEE